MTDVAELSAAESRHACGSRRLSVGDEILLFDGKGAEATGVITEASKSALRARVGPLRQTARRRPSLTIATAVPKGPRQDMLIEKCTEFGVSRIWPIVTERSVVSASEHKLDKWRRTTIEAAKQSGQCWLPELCAAAGLDRVLEETGGSDLALVASPGGDPIAAMMTRWREAQCVLALVGPEGGWSPDEFDRMRGAGLSFVSLGPNVLRIETAAIAVAAVNHAVQELA